MNDGQAEQRPAGFRLAGDALQFRFRHAGIMLKLQRGERSRLVAAQADETDQARQCRCGPRESASASAAASKGLTCSIWTLIIKGGGAHPPVIGGKKAISLAPAIDASGFACFRSIAARAKPPEKA